MLVHNLPIAASPMQRRAVEEPNSNAGHIPVVPMRKARVVLQGLDVLALTASTWPVLAPAYASALPTGLLALLAIIVGWWAVSDRLPAYDSPHLVSLSGLCRSGLVCGGVGCSLLLLVAVVTASAGDRTVTSAFYGGVLFIACEITVRIIWWTILRSLLADGYCIDRAIILAENTSAARILAANIERVTAGRLRASICRGVTVTGGVPDITQIEALLKAKHATRAVLAAGDLAPDAYNRLLSALAALPAGITVVSNSGQLRHIGCSGRDLVGITFPEQPLSRAGESAKRAMDIIVASLVLVFLCPVFVGIALAIRSDSPGNAIFKQKRVGKNGLVFDIWKFRTMYDHLRDDLAKSQTTRNDHRVTRIGNLLRRTSLDELPQVVNVLRGQMSIVGPRPHALGMTVNGQALDTVLPSYDSRHRVKPGITGWAQINGCRGELATSRAVKRRVALDCHYIDNWSIGLDTRIILRTASLLVLDRHAY